MRLTNDHNARVPEEKARVLATPGGKVELDGELCCALFLCLLLAHVCMYLGMNYLLGHWPHLKIECAFCVSIFVS